MRAAPLTVVCLLFTPACGIPRDADHTMDRIRHGTVRVGVVQNPPWVIAGEQVRGVEPALVADAARQVDARIEWVRWPESELMRALHDRKVDVVLAGILDTTPWGQEVALTTPYFVEQRSGDRRRHVVAVAPGENAWLAHVERVLRQHRDAVPSLLATVQ
jgi:polar amino acid transport system substrate-binding protein